MVDRNLRNFQGRLGRIERTHEAGGGFEAAGALGMSYFNRRQRPRQRSGFIGAGLIVAMAVIGIKAGVHASIGPESYAERIAALNARAGADKVAAFVLQADPVTVLLADQFRKLKP